MADSPKTELAEERTDFAEDRTDFAEDRTVLANERTFAGWLRTGLASVAVGLGFNALFGKMQPEWAPKAISTVFVCIGILIFYLAARKARLVLKRLNPHQVTPVGVFTVQLMAAVLTAGALALIAAVWLARFE